MSVRRWVGIAGVVVAVAAGTAGATRDNSQFEAEVSVQLGGAQPPGSRFLFGRERLLNSPEVMELVRLRLGDTPPVWVTAQTDDTVLVRSRGPSPWQAAEATKTYAQSYVDVTRRRVEADVSVAVDDIRRKTDEIRSQLESADEPQRTSLTGLLQLFNSRLDTLQLDLHGPSVVGATPAEPVADGFWTAWSVAALGAALAAGAAVSARRAGRRHSAVE